MKIPAQLEQFNHGGTLIIAAGNQDMRAYFAENGLIEQILSFRIPKPAYSDREGFYQSSSGSGAVLRPVERSIRLDFKKELKDKLCKIAKEYPIKKVIVFAPKRNQHETIDLITKDIQRKISIVISGNYFEDTPFELIKKIAKATQKPKIIPTKESAQKILNGTRHKRP